MLSNFFGFQGRIGRGTWWLAYFLSIMIMVVSYVLLGLGEGVTKTQPAAAMPFLLLAIVGNLLALVILVCTCVKRYHDRNKSGWWFWIGLIPVIGGLWQLIELGFCSGADGDNDYGPPPGAERRMDSLKGEIAGMSSNSKLAKLDDNYLAEYARKVAMQQAEAQSSSGSSSTFGGSPAKPVFGKR